MSRRSVPDSVQVVALAGWLQRHDGLERGGAFLCT